MLDIFLSIFIALISSFAIMYLKFIYDSNYWKRRGIPGPYHLKTNYIENQAPLVMNVNYPSVFLFRDWTKEYGPIYGYNEGQRKVLVTSDPEIAHEVMVKKFEYFHGRKLNPIVGDVEKDPRVHVFNAKGARWKRLRNTASPCFNAASLKKILPTIQDCANITRTFLDQAFIDGKPFNIHSYFQEYTMDVISRVALGQGKTLQFKNPNIELVKEVLFVFANNPFDYWAHVFPKAGKYIRKVMFAAAKFKHIPIRECINQLYDTVAKRKAERSQTNPDELASIDFIDLILDVEDNSVVDGVFEKTNMKVPKKLTDEEIVGQCFVFLLAGFDTTANTLGNTAWFLAKNPVIQEKLCEEIDDIVGDGCNEITYEHLGSMPYADAVMKETLRHYPVAAFAASRECQIPTTIGPGIEIEKDVCVALDLYTLHFDKKIWGEDSEEFKPERFFDMTPLQQMSYYPFGGGPRLCVGMRLAYIEEKLMLVKVLQKYYIRECSETETKLKQIGNTISTPKKVTVVLEKRKH